MIVIAREPPTVLLSLSLSHQGLLGVGSSSVDVACSIFRRNCTLPTKLAILEAISGLLACLQPKVRLMATKPPTGLPSQVEVIWGLFSERSALLQYLQPRRHRGGPQELSLN